MHKTIQVELVGGESTSILGIPGTVFVAGAAVIAAILAATVTIWKMRRDLAHDREMRDREDARNLLYASLDAVDETLISVRRFADSVEDIEATLKNGMPDETTNAKRQLFDEAQTELETNLRQLNAMIIRLAVRFSDKRFGRALDLLRDDGRAVQGKLEAGRTRRLTAEEWVELRGSLRQLAKGGAVFGALCNEWFTGEDSMLRAADRAGVTEYLNRT